jgi:predicted PurR-regulated permease PerM
MGEAEVKTSERHVVLDISPYALLKIAIAGALVWLLIHTWNVLLLVLISLMLVATFNPLVGHLQRRSSRSWALGLVITGFLVLLASPVGLIGPMLLEQCVNLAQNMPRNASALQAILAAHGMHVNLQDQVQRAAGMAAEQLPHVVGEVAIVIGHLVDILTIVILTIYLLIEGPEVAEKLLSLLPPGRRPGVQQLTADLGVQIGGYVRGQIILSSMAGVYFLLLLVICGIPNALALALIAALADAIPIVGLLIALVPSSLAALAVSPGTAGTVVLFYLLYHQIEANIISPRIFGNTLGLSVSVIVVAIAIGVQLLGVLGAVLALPAAAAIPLIARYIRAVHAEDPSVSQAIEIPVASVLPEAAES